MVLYISELRPDLLDDICGELFLIMDKIQKNELKKFIVGNGANFEYVSHFVIDLSSVNDDKNEILEAVCVLRSMYKSKRIIIIADKEPSNSILLSQLVEKGVYDIAVDLTNDELKKCLLTGKTKEEAAIFSMAKPDLTGQLVKKEIPKQEALKVSTKQQEVESPKKKVAIEEKILADRSFRRNKPFVAVSICSTQPHMGATHQALLITKFLNTIGFKACYLEANPRRNILNVANTYSVNANEKNKMLQYDGVDMYFDFKLKDVIAVGYDFYILDFGNFAEVEATSFLTKDIKIFVGGGKPWEMAVYKTIFDSIGSGLNINFILNFVHQKEIQRIKEFMGEHRKNTYISEYVPYPYEKDVNIQIYKEIFRDYISVEKSETTGTQKKHKKILTSRG